MDTRTSRDISPILEGWDHIPGQVVARKIIGLDGGEKLQLRVELGVFQMELAGRPDGKNPHDVESLLDYQRDRLREHSNLHGSDMDFHLTIQDCEDLHSEGIQYYYRYLALFHLGEYNPVIRDTARNLEMLDFVKEYGSKDWDRMTLEQYRPYILMMNTRARASRSIGGGEHDEALKAVVEGIDNIRGFFGTINQRDVFEKCNEVVYLRNLAEEIVKQMKKDPIHQLREQMEQAVQHEEYERAAELRDRIRRLEEEVQREPSPN